MPGFMDTFFFLSLGIAFVLILLLVYHFKQRLTTTENKCDTMFEIINGLASEVNSMKGALVARMPPRPPVQMPPQMPLPHGPMFSNMSNENLKQENVQDLENDDEVNEEDSDDEEEDSDDEEEDSDDEEEEETDGEEEEEREDMDVVGTKMIIQQDNEEEKILVSDNEEVVEEKPDYDKMNLVNLKKYVIENGLIENPKKMKKSEIIEALTSM